MLDPWIIEQIRRREEEERRRDDRPVLEVPMDHPASPSDHDRDADRERDRGRDRNRPERGVTILNYSIS